LVHPLRSVSVTVYKLETEGVNATPFKTPPVQTKLPAPTPIKLTGDPLQTVSLGAIVKLTAGIGFTVMVMDALSIHPVPFVPITVYVLVVAGIKFTPFTTPLFQLYEVAPVPESETDDPIQMEAPGEEMIPTLGAVITFTVAIAVFVQPFKSVPVTV